MWPALADHRDCQAVLMCSTYTCTQTLCHSTYAHTQQCDGTTLRKPCIAVPFTGQVVIACHERKVRVLQATVLLKDGWTLPVTIPINLTVHFALLSAENSETFWGCPKLSVKDISHPKDGCVPKVD